MSKISIALCAYNGADFLSEQLESFIRQTRLPDELVIGDDHSTDETVKIIERFAKSAPFPVFLKVNNKNLGSTKNFENTISRCSGDLIFLSDQDDVWLEEKISRIETSFMKEDASLLFSNAELVDENLKSLGQNLWDLTFPENKRKAALEGKLIELLLQQNVVTGATTAFRSSLRGTFLPIPVDIPNLIHDGWISLILAAGGNIKFIDEPLIKYRQHSNQQLGVNFRFKPIKNYDERRKHFDDSIVYLQKEKARLSQIKKIFAEFPQFRKIIESGAIENFILEKQQLAEHYIARRDLPLNRRERLIPVSREMLSGRYSRFSRGFLSAAKDIFEKWTI
jgi:glycosyltransferase involved in cell wall biosynthesis